jgi:hypothetical protein
MKRLDNSSGKFLAAIFDWSQSSRSLGVRMNLRLKSLYSAEGGVGGMTMSFCSTSGGAEISLAVLEFLGFLLTLSLNSLMMSSGQSSKNPSSTFFLILG